MESQPDRVLYVGSQDSESVGQERALIANGITVSSVVTPENAVSYVRNSTVNVVLLDADSHSSEVSSIAGALKVAKPAVRIIALSSTEEPPSYVDAVVVKPVDLDALLAAVQHNLSLRGEAQ
jgi:DNA-binding NtrC family response regulator